MQQNKIPLPHLTGRGIFCLREPGGTAAAPGTGGFHPADGDLWEYLCGGENGALFPWGDRLPEPEELSWRENGFGLRIGYDHEGYRREVIRDCPWPFRGGDGGELACYGTLPALGPVVGSAHFLGWFGSSWDENRESIEMLLMDGLDGEYDFFRRILLLG